MEGEDYDGVYDPTVADQYEMLAELGDIVDSTDPTQTSGVLYVKIIDGGYGGFTNGYYIAVAWKSLTASSVSFQTHGGFEGGVGYASLDAVKAALNNANNTSQFDSFYDYVK
jgi:hypothetical protein